MMAEITPLAARRAVDQVLDHYPPDRLPSLISFQAVKGARDEVADLVIGLADEDMAVLRSSEEISMPRGLFGSRPVRVPTLHEIALLHHLTELVSDRGFNVRTRPQRSEFYSFNCGPDHSHQARFDVSAYYEYVDHERLRSELALRGNRPAIIDDLCSTLGALYPDRRGLPQMLRASDVLADMYLSPVDRALHRQGYDFRRYADDYRVNVAGWAATLALMDDIAERIRSLGLTLSSLKTKILTSAEVDHRDDRLSRLLNKYAAKWEELLTEEVWIGEYEDIEVKVIEPAKEEAIHHALLDLAEQWLRIHNSRRDAESQDEQQRNPLSELLTTILTRLEDAEAALPKEFLGEVPFADPVRLQAVCEYLLEGPLETHGRWDVLTNLVGQGRQSPWARIWLAHTIASLADADGGEAPRSVVDWLHDLVTTDRHELVRAEAVYGLAVLGVGADADWQGLVDRATFLTHPGLAAAAGRAEIDAAVKKSFTGSSALPLLKAAFEWGESRAG